MDRSLPFLKQPSDGSDSEGGHSGADHQPPHSPKYEGNCETDDGTFANPEGAEASTVWEADARRERLLRRWLAGAHAQKHRALSGGPNSIAFAAGIQVLWD
jgi:hypothetical protein